MSKIVVPSLVFSKPVTRLELPENTHLIDLGERFVTIDEKSSLRAFLAGAQSLLLLTSLFSIHAARKYHPYVHILHEYQ